jgi:hypothetical protein
MNTVYGSLLIDCAGELGLRILQTTELEFLKSLWGLGTEEE